MRNSPSGGSRYLLFEDEFSPVCNNTGRVVMAWDILIMLTPLRAEGREPVDPRPGQ